jgi:hypothetical protein
VQCREQQGLKAGGILDLREGKGGNGCSNHSRGKRCCE